MLAYYVHLLEEIVDHPHECKTIPECLKDVCDVVAGKK